MNQIVKDNIKNDIKELYTVLNPIISDIYDMDKKLQTRLKELDEKDKKIKESMKTWGLNFNLAKCENNPRVIEIEAKCVVNLINQIHEFKNSISKLNNAIDDVKRNL